MADSKKTSDIVEFLVKKMEKKKLKLKAKLEKNNQTQKVKIEESEKKAIYFEPKIEFNPPEDPYTLVFQVKISQIPTWTV